VSHDRDSHDKGKSLQEIRLMVRWSFQDTREGERGLTSYSKPEATVKMLISACFLTSTTSCLAPKKDENLKNEQSQANQLGEAEPTRERNANSLRRDGSNEGTLSTPRHVEHVGSFHSRFSPQSREQSQSREARNADAGSSDVGRR